MTVLTRFPHHTFPHFPATLVKYNQSIRDQFVFLRVIVVVKIPVAEILAERLEMRRIDQRSVGPRPIRSVSIRDVRDDLIAET